MAPRPGRIAEVFKITLARPRDMDANDLSAPTQRIAAALKATAATGEAPQ